MSFVINDNLFSIDSYSHRTARLSLLSSHIERHAEELHLEAAMLEWAVNADEEWRNERLEQTNKQGERDVAFQNSQEADKELHAKIVTIKPLLVARYDRDEEILGIYGIRGRIPRTHGAKVALAYAIVSGHEVRKAEGDPKVLPDSMIAALKSATDKADDAYKDALKKSGEAKEFSKSLRELFDSDSAKLHSLHTWMKVYWGSYDPRYIAVGFVQGRKRRAGYPKPPIGLAYDESAKKFSWDETHLATSYQLAYAKYIPPPPDTGKRKRIRKPDWEEIYEGADNFCVFDPGEGEWQFKVRARNKHGFGKWSEILICDLCPSESSGSGTESNTVI